MSRWHGVMRQNHSPHKENEDKMWAGSHAPLPGHVLCDMRTAVEKFHRFPSAPCELQSHHFPLVHTASSSLFLLNIHVTFFYVVMSAGMHVCAPYACLASVDPMELKLEGVVNFHGVLKTKSQVLFKNRQGCAPVKHLQLLLHGSLRDVYNLNQRRK